MATDRASMTLGWLVGRRIAAARVTSGESVRIIPTGGTYYVGVTSDTLSDYTGATTALTAGDAFPETVSDGDVYVYGDYEYRYNRGCSSASSWGTGILGISYAVEGTWGVRVLDASKTSYGKILSVINGKEVGALVRTFNGCNYLTESPEIPETIQSMWCAFASCDALKTPPVIPSGVTTMYSAFHGCPALEVPPIIPDGVTSLTYTFYGCTALKEPPAIPASVTSMDHTFRNCESLTTVPDLSNIVKCASLEYFLYGCDNITDISAFVIPEGVVSLDYAFSHSGVTNIAGLVIPSSVTTMKHTFSYTDITDISNLSIPEGVTDMHDTFFDTPVENISGFTIPSTVTTLTGIFAHCDSLGDVTGLTISGNIEYMTEAFFSCDNLTGTIHISAESILNFGGAFKNTVQPIVLTGTGTNTAILNSLASTANNGNVTVA